MTISSFTSSNIDQVQADVNAAIAQALAKHGLSHSFGNIRFSPDNYTSKISINVGDVMDAKAAEFARYASRFGIDKSKFGSTFYKNGKTFTIVGIKPKGRKYPIIANDAQGNSYKFPAEVAQS